MADRRPEDAAPPTAPFTPVPDQPEESRQRATYDEQREISKRINAAYASSAPVVDDGDSPRGGRRGGGQKGGGQQGGGQQGGGQQGGAQKGGAQKGAGQRGAQRRAGQRGGQRVAAPADAAPGDAGEPRDEAPATNQGDRRPSGAERFAAVLAATTGRGSRTGPVKQEEPGALLDSPMLDARPEAQPAVAQRPATPRKSPAARPGAPRKVRRARLRLTHLDPWSVMKTSFLLSVAIGIVTVVAVAVVWSVLGAAGVWSSIDSAIGDVLGESGEGFRIEDYLGMSRVMGFTLIVAAVDVVLITVIATLGAFLYNLAAALLGGVEVVLAEDDR